MAHFYVNIGSNLGDRHKNISLALDAIELEFGRYNASNPVESEPWGFDSTNLFVNIGIEFESEEEPLAVLRKLQAIEKSVSPGSHRNEDGSYRDRGIDIDIMAIDDLVINTPDLKVPHPFLHERYFFLKPMAELCPSWVHPLLNKPVNCLISLVLPEV